MKGEEYIYKYIYIYLSEILHSEHRSCESRGGRPGRLKLVIPLVKDVN